MTDDMIAFIRARLADDEKLPLQNDDELNRITTKWAERAGYPVEVPARVLRGVAAKRRILERHRPVLIEGRDPDGEEREGYFCKHDDDPWPCADVRDIASEWSDHPHYQESWAL